MPRNYKRKTNRGTTPHDVMERAAKAVGSGQSIRNAAKEFKIDKMTLQRYIVKKDKTQGTGYLAVSLRHMAIPPNMERDLASHLKQLAVMSHGLSRNRCCSLAYEFAKQNNLKVPSCWDREKKAGRDWWLGFKKRQNLVVKSPGATSPGLLITEFNIQVDIDEIKQEELSPLTKQDLLPSESSPDAKKEVKTEVTEMPVEVVYADDKMPVKQEEVEVFDEDVECSVPARVVEEDTASLSSDSNNFIGFESDMFRTGNADSHDKSHKDKKRKKDKYKRPQKHKQDHKDNLDKLDKENLSTGSSNPPSPASPGGQENGIPVDT